MGAKPVYMLLLAIAMLPACCHKDFESPTIPSKEFHVDFDWRFASGDAPESMTVAFYPESGTDSPVRSFEFYLGEGGKVSLAQGSYNVICYNSNTPANQFRNTHDIREVEVFTREGWIFEPVFGATQRTTQRPPGEERVVIDPDEVWVCSAGTLRVSDQGVTLLTRTRQSEDCCHSSIAGSDTLRLVPHPEVHRYSFEIRDVENLQTIQQMGASISGLSPSLKLADHTRSRETVTVPCEAYAADRTTIRGELRTFGHNPESGAKVKLTLYAWHSNGRAYYYEFDATPQVHAAPDRRNVQVVFSKLSLPKPVAKDSGFEPGVEDWEHEDRELTL